MLTLKNFKSTMVAKAKKVGIYENFGQTEIKALEKKYKPNPYGTDKERQIDAKILELDRWAMNFDISQIN